MTPAVAHRLRIERTIVELIVHEAISKGYSITVDYNDGEDDKPIVKSTDAAEILKHTMATDEENLLFYRPDGSYAGFVFLVYGNDGYDAINDYTDSIEMHEEILHRAVIYANTAEDQAFDERIAEKEKQETSDDPDDWHNKSSRLHY